MCIRDSVYTVCEWNALFGSLVRDGTEHTHIGGYGIMAPPFTEPVSYTHLDVYKRQGWKLCRKAVSAHASP